MSSPSAASEGHRLRKLVTPTVQEHLVIELRRLILSGELRPGERLIEERLTEQFGVSRPPLREALRILQRDGLIRTVPRRGSVVTPLTAEDVREIYSLRWALERLAIELAVPVRDDATLRPLRDALEVMTAAAMSDNPEALVEANWEFHLALCGMPRHRRLMHAYESLTLQLRLCMAMNLRSRKEMYGDPEETVTRHRELLELIEAGDSRAILKRLEHHGDRSFLQRLEEPESESGIGDAMGRR